MLSADFSGSPPPTGASFMTMSGATDSLGAVALRPATLADAAAIAAIYNHEVENEDRKSTRLNSSHTEQSRMPSSA